MSSESLANSANNELEKWRHALNGLYRYLDAFNARLGDRNCEGMFSIDTYKAEKAAKQLILSGKVHEWVQVYSRHKLNEAFILKLGDYTLQVSIFSYHMGVRRLEVDPETCGFVQEFVTRMDNI